MTLDTPLFQLCKDSLGCEDEYTTAFFDAIKALQEGTQPQLDFIHRMQGTETSDNPWDRIDTGENLLSAALLAAITGKKISEYPYLLSNCQAFIESASWPNISLIEAQAQLLGVLAGSEEVHVPVTDGYYPFAEGRYWSWADVPFMLQHAHLGIIHALLAFFKPDSGCRATSKAIADWQTQLLDYDGLPTTLFQREGVATEVHLLAAHYLLYRAVSQLHQCPRSAAISERALSKLSEITRAGSIPAYLYVVEFFLDQQLPSPVPEAAMQLPEMIADTNALIAGFRTPRRAVICTTAGSRTGLGYIRNEDARILSYGPQVAPYTECQHYGIEAPADLSNAGIQVGDAVFKLSRLLKLSIEPALSGHPATFGMLPAPFEYAEVQQEFANETLHIQYKPFSARAEDLAFVFFAQANHCLLADGTFIKRKSLERFDGQAQPIALQSSRGTLTLQPSEPTRMQIIPLAGGEMFWGADYLIAFKTPDNGFTYRWKVT